MGRAPALAQGLVLRALIEPVIVWSHRSAILPCHAIMTESLASFATLPSCRLVLRFAVGVSTIPGMAPDLMYDAARRILLIRFGRSLTQPALAEMQTAAQAFAARMGGCDAVIDFSEVTEVDVPSRYLASLAQQKPVLAGHRRIIVAPKEVVFGLSRMFGTQQHAVTGEAPAVVRTLREAYDALGVGEPDFKPVEPG